ncbi:sensor histidine kinase [[Ruminococcus] torques]|uniref:sensor histidine kinase n=1 Tax=[Ruminococcus] torques TaxID=33039 RepID=UPI00241D439A|nr:cation diffusion facilitator family transporter [[Ruminococcus] torques]
MTKALIRLFIKDAEDTRSAAVRERYGILSGAVGLACNLFLFALKLTIGLVTGAISIAADAFNNLSDGLSCMISIVGFKVANREPDAKHPFGYGRTEYIAGLIVSFIIVLVGFEFFKTSLDRILHPAAVAFSAVLMGILAVLTILFAFALARWQTNRLIKPINELDLERPLDSDIYEELSPLLEAMDRQNREKEAVANMRKEFSANVSHELKTPLTSISGYAEIMKNGLVRPEDISGFSERIYKEARRLITLIEDIIKLSKLDEESVELEKEDVDLYELTREIVSRLSPQAAQKNIRIELSGESVHYHGIRQILDEMVYNVCENAVKYNYENGKVSVWAGNTLNGPKISVSDTGIGIPKEHQERIFERFYRVDKSHSKERGGTGLGLSIVKHGALLHGAKVSVESEEGRGTKISMQFPRICQK